MKSTPNRVLANAGALIEALAANGPLSPAEIAERIGVARSSVYRLAEGMAAIGLTEFTDDSRVRLAMRWLHLADAAARGMAEWREAQPILDAAERESGQTVFLSVPRDAEATCIAWAPGRGIDLLALKPGRSLPLHAGAAGRSILANSPDLVSRLEELAPFTQLTEHTLVTLDALQQDIESSRARGFTFSDEDVTIGIGAVGVPIIDGDRLLGCLSAGGLVQDIREQRDELVPMLETAAEQLLTAASRS